MCSKYNWSAEMRLDLEIALAISFSFGALSGLATAWVRSFALARNVLDVPNERSSHAVPTPRGGGVAIVFSFALAIGSLAFFGLVAPALAVALSGAGLLTAAVGFADDRCGLSARLRFAAHVAAALLALWSLWPVAAVSGFGLVASRPWVLIPAFVVFIAWCINLFNFMDGIDGIASIETMSIAAGGAVLASLVALPQGAAAPLALVACIGGFLVWNWPPARIFMGDAGSGFLGLVVAVLALWQASLAPQLFWSWLILMGCFMVDATTTLLRRVRRGQSFHTAHRSHAYQFAARRHKGHLPVSLAFGAITLLWLLPWACAVALKWLDGGWALVVAYMPLVRLAYAYKAGDAAAQERAEAERKHP